MCCFILYYIKILLSYSSLTPDISIYWVFNINCPSFSMSIKITHNASKKGTTKITITAKQSLQNIIQRRQNYLLSVFAVPTAGCVTTNIYVYIVPRWWKQIFTPMITVILVTNMYLKGVPHHNFHEIISLLIQYAVTVMHPSTTASLGWVQLFIMSNRLLLYLDSLSLAGSTTSIPLCMQTRKNDWVT